MQCNWKLTIGSYPHAAFVMAAEVNAIVKNATRVRTLRLPSGAHDARGRAVIGDIRLRVSRAPVVIVGSSGLKECGVALVAIAETTPARALAAAVVIRDHVVRIVARVVASADPGDERHVGAGRAHGLRTAAASAQESVDRAMPPVLAGRGIPGI